jgi:hypothetical protein
MSLEPLDARVLLTSYSLFNSTMLPAISAAHDPGAVELGVRFDADTAGEITALHIYRGTTDTVPYVGHLWTASGTLLATVTFPAGVGAGWRTATLSQPVSIVAHADYIASYYDSNGGYAATAAGLVGGVSSGPLHTSLSSNGLYRYGPDVLPNLATFANYWIDVDYTPDPPAMYTLFAATAQPAIPAAGDTGAVELGVRFDADLPGQVSALRIYRGTTDAAPFVGHLWTATGALLATVTFPAGVGPGWRTATLAQPMAITPGMDFIASYYAPHGGYAGTAGGLAGGVSNGPLHTSLSSNGLYRYGPDVLPNLATFANYWIDVVYTSQPTNPPMVYVANQAQFQQALTNPIPGEQILVLPGTYQGDLSSTTLQGTAAQPIVIRAADPTQIPIIQGGTDGIYLSSPRYVTLQNLIFSGASSTGINMDDGGNYGSAHDVVLNNVSFLNTGYNCVKMSGIDNFQLLDVTVQGWASGSACGMDLVGCHNGVIANCTLSNNDATGYGLQMKGGSANIVVKDSQFEHAGLRAIQIGGSTDALYFRPAFQGYEAKNITVEGNVIIGSIAAVAFSSVDGATVEYNTIYRPQVWVMRILCEDSSDGYIPCRDGVFTNNIVVFRSDEVATTVNIGIATAPQTFQFANNWWYCLNNPALSTPTLPTPEVGGVYGVDPQLVNPDNGNLQLQPSSPAKKYGAYALPS